VILDLKDLLALKKLEYCIRDSVTRKTLKTLPVIVSQASCMVRHLNTIYGRSPIIYKKTKTCIGNIHENFILSIAQDGGASDPGYVNKIKSLTVGTSAHL